MCLPLDQEYKIYLGPARLRIVEMINALRTVFEIPLLIINLFCILYEIFLG
jgi:hypothetical protein